MARLHLWRSGVILLLIVAGGVVGLWRREAVASRQIETLPTYGRVPEFLLVDQDGRAISLNELHGRIWVADFIFTRCAGQCPLMSSRMAELASVFQAQPVVWISFSVDPQWDTPEVLARYARAYGALPDRWRFVTGDHAAIERLCQEGFRLSVDADGGSAQEPITHSARFVLVDQAGEIRGYYDAQDEAAMGRLQRDLRRLLARRS